MLKMQVYRWKRNMNHPQENIVIMFIFLFCYYFVNVLALFLDF